MCHLSLCPSLIMTWLIAWGKYGYAIWHIKILKSSVKEHEITFSGKQINFVTNYKYLSVIIDNTMTLNGNFNRTYKAASAHLQLLSKMKSFTTFKARYVNYTSMIIPLLTYSCPIQSTFTKTQLDSFLLSINVQKQCYPVSHSLQVSTTIWNVNVLAWWKSVWTESLHVTYLIIILR